MADKLVFIESYSCHCITLNMIDISWIKESRWLDEAKESRGEKVKGAHVISMWFWTGKVGVSSPIVLLGSRGRGVLVSLSAWTNWFWTHNGWSYNRMLTAAVVERIRHSSNLQCLLENFVTFIERLDLTRCERTAFSIALITSVFIQAGCCSHIHSDKRLIVQLTHAVP